MNSDNHREGNAHNRKFHQGKFGAKPYSSSDRRTERRNSKKGSSSYSGQAGRGEHTGRTAQGGYGRRGSNGARGEGAAQSERRSLPVQGRFAERSAGRKDFSLTRDSRKQRSFHERGSSRHHPKSSGRSFARSSSQSSFGKKNFLSDDLDFNYDKEIDEWRCDDSLMEFFASCPGGMEFALANELKDQCGVKRTRPLRGGVAFYGDLRDAYTACLWSRLASRVFYVIGRCDARNDKELYEGVKALAWSRNIPVDKTISVYAHGTNDELHNTQFSALRAKDALCDALRAGRGRRPNVNLSNPDVLIDVNIRQDRATISIDLCGTSLHHRPYEMRRSTREGVKSALAAAALEGAWWYRGSKEGRPFVDPLACDGYMITEAAQVAADMAPNLTRARWGFFGWNAHDPQLWEDLIEEAEDRLDKALASMPPLYAFTPNEHARSHALNLLKRAGLQPYVTLIDWNDRTDIAKALKALEKHLETLDRLNAEDFKISLSSQDKRQDEECQSCEPVTDEAQEQASLVSAVRGVAASILPFKSQEGDLVSIEAHRQCLAAMQTLPGLWKYLFVNDTDLIERYIASRPAKQPTRIILGKTKALIYRYNRLERETNCEVRIYDACQHVDRIVPVLEAGTDQFVARLKKNVRERRKWAERNNISCYRIYDADLPDYAVAIDLYQGAEEDSGKNYLVIAEYQAPREIDPKKAQARFQDVLTLAPLIIGVTPDQVFTRTRFQDKGGAQYQMKRNQRVHACVEEYGCLFEVDFTSYLDTGLFLDHRTTRHKIAQIAKGKSFLNLFAYTGSATVHAARGQARSTLTIDLSQTYLDWAERNMLKNEIAGKEHRYLRSDVMTWIRNEVRVGRSYDLIFVDPPTFSNSKAMGKETWSVQRDHPELLEGVSRLLSGGGVAIFSCNLRSFKPDFDELVRRGVKIVDVSTESIPHDFERNQKIHHCYLVVREGNESGLTQVQEVFARRDD